MNLSWHNTDQVRVSSRLTYFYKSNCPLLKFCFPDFWINLYQHNTDWVSLWSAFVGVMPLEKFVGAGRGLVLLKQYFQNACWYSFLPYSQSYPHGYPHDLPWMTSLSSTGGGWQATQPVSRVKWLWRHRQTRQNSNVARLDSSNFPTFTLEKYLFGTYRRKIIIIYCPVVTEKSTNPGVKFTCPCLGKPWHGQSEFDTRVSWFLSHHRTIDVGSISQ